jgi:5-methyltetrahydrofolate--homocysteine methyltransferase
VVHVLDASRAVSVVGSLINPEQKPKFAASVATDYEQLRAQHQGQQTKPLLSLGEARRRRTAIEWSNYTPPKPEFLGVRIVSSDGLAESLAASSGIMGVSVGLEEIANFIDWSPFFHAWEIRGRYPAILENAKARELFDDVQPQAGEMQGTMSVVSDQPVIGLTIRQTFDATKEFPASVSVLTVLPVLNDVAR